MMVAQLNEYTKKPLNFIVQRVNLKVCESYLNKIKTHKPTLYILQGYLPVKEHIKILEWLPERGREGI